MRVNVYFPGEECRSAALAVEAMADDPQRTLAAPQGSNLRG
jgi:hypothetical protein